MCEMYEPPDGGWDTMIPGGAVLIVTHPDDFEWADDWLTKQSKYDTIKELGEHSTQIL